MRFLYNRTFQQWSFQAIVLSLVLWACWTIWQNTLTNLEQQGIASGFHFLQHNAGFDIIMHLLPFKESDPYHQVFYIGILNTLVVSFLGIIISSVLGFLLGIARLSSNYLIAKLALIYIEILRNIPLLLQIFFWYFAVLRSLPSPKQSLNLYESIFLNNRGLYLPAINFEDHLFLFLASIIISIIFMFILNLYAKKYQQRTGKQIHVARINLAILFILPALTFFMSGTQVHWEFPALRGFNFRGGMVMIPEFMALVLALSTYTAAFIAEIVRAGIQAVPHGQSEAAKSLALSRSKALRLIIIPQALRVILPPLTNQYLNLTKNSSLATAIAFPDLVAVFAGTVLNQTGQAVEIIGMTMAVYLFISLSISMLMTIYTHMTGRWSQPQ